MTTASTHPTKRPGLARRFAKWMCMAFIALVICGMTGWGTLFLRFSPLPGDMLRTALAIAFVLGTPVAFVALKDRRRTILVFLLLFAALVTWFYLIPPSNNRNWAPEVAVMPTAEIKGNLVTIKNIRNFDYRSETDFTPRYYDKTFDLDKLESTDIMCIYWGMSAIAHVIVSFGFGGDNFVAFSIEMRNEEGEENSMAKSFFRQYELIYIVADERDVVRVRTNFRDPREDVHIYRTRIPIEIQRKLFLSYVDKIDGLSRTPEWYNTLEDNCTTGVLQRTHAYQGRAKYNWKLLLSGYTGEYMYELGGLDTSMPFPELAERCLINKKVEALQGLDDFSVRIREGLPMPQPVTMVEFTRDR